MIKADSGKILTKLSSNLKQLRKKVEEQENVVHYKRNYQITRHGYDNRIESAMKITSRKTFAKYLILTKIVLLSSYGMV